MTGDQHEDGYAAHPKPSRYWSCWPDTSGLDDTELLALVDDMTRTVLGFLDPEDADILSRADLQGQAVALIARDTGRPEADIEKRLLAARQSLCRFVVLTLPPIERAG